MSGPRAGRLTDPAPGKGESMVSQGLQLGTIGDAAGVSLEMAAKPTAAPDGAAAPGVSVTDLVAETVIPHLLVTCRTNGAPRAPTQVHVDTLARLLLSRDETAPAAQIAALAQSGIGLESLLHDLITPAARRLGEYWHADSVTFLDVTLAMGRLTAIVRGLCRETGRDLPADAPRALIATCEAERHGLGIAIVAQSFRAAQWRVQEVPGGDRDALGREVAATGYALVGLSVGSERTAAHLPALVAMLRRRSRNGHLLVALGGAGVMADPDCAARCGADFVAANGREAVRLAREHLSCPPSTEKLRSTRR